MSWTSKGIWIGLYELIALGDQLHESMCWTTIEWGGGGGNCTEHLCSVNAVFLWYTYTAKQITKTVSSAWLLIWKMWRTKSRGFVPLFLQSISIEPIISSTEIILISNNAQQDIQAIHWMRVWVHENKIRQQCPKKSQYLAFIEHLEQLWVTFFAWGPIKKKCLRAACSPALEAIPRSTPYSPSWSE